MEIIKPEKIKPGDVIGIIAPSSPVSDGNKLDAGVKYFEKMGYRVKVGLNALKERGYLAGTDAERVDDLHNMFLDKNVKLIICLRGGYGATRLLDKIDYNIIGKHPKIFCGYSDATALQNAFFYKTGLVSLAGPMVGVDFWKDVSPFTEESFWSSVTTSETIKIKYSDGGGLKSFGAGNAEGRLIGGNLALFSSMAGTKYLPDPEGKILLLEETGEVPYRIDRMLNQLRLIGYLDKVKGVILGGFTDCEETDTQRKSLALAEVIGDYFTRDFKSPVIYNLDHGHLINNLTIPIGVNVRINSISCSIEFLESHLA
jgi:muramoyltetrapeptide carboxypeptidase